MLNFFIGDKEYKNINLVLSENTLRFMDNVHTLLCWSNHYWLLLKIVISIRCKTLLGNEEWGAVDSITHCEKWLPLK